MAPKIPISSVHILYNFLLSVGGACEFDEIVTTIITIGCKRLHYSSLGVGRVGSQRMCSCWVGRKQASFCELPALSRS